MAALNDTTGLLGNYRAAYINLLKDYYVDQWNNHIHEAGGQVVRKLGQTGGRMGGKKVVGAVTIGIPQSAGISGFERMILPRPSSGTYINPEIVSRGLFTRLRWTLEVELAAKAGDKAAWMAPRMKDMEDAATQFDINFNRKMWSGYGDILGVVASHAVVSSASVLTLYSRQNRVSQGAAFWYSGRFHLKAGMQVGFIDSAQGALGSPQWDISVPDISTTANAAFNLVVASVGGTNDAPTVTLSTDVTQAPYSFTPADGDFLVAFGNRQASISATASDAISQFSSINGIMNLATDTTHYAASYGLSKATYPTLGGLLMTNPAGAGTARTFRERLVHIAFDRLSEEGTGKSPDCLFLNVSIRREVVNEHDGDRQYAPVINESGYGRLVANVGDNRVEYVTDWQAPPGQIALLRSDTWRWLSLQDLAPLNPERWVADYAQTEIILSKHGNEECTEPLSNGILDDLIYDQYAPV